MKLIYKLLIVIITSLLVTPTIAAWYDADLLYRDEWNVTADRDYTDVTDDVNLTWKTNMANNFSDVVFTDSSDQLLPFYLLDKSDENWAIFRIKQAVGSTGDYRVYYGTRTSSNYEGVRSNAAGTSRASYSSDFASRLSFTSQTARGNVIDYTSGNGYLTITDFQYGGGAAQSTDSSVLGFPMIQVTFRNRENWIHSFGLAMPNSECNPTGVSGINQEKVYNYLDGTTDFNSQVRGLSRNYNGQLSYTLPFGTNVQLDATYSASFSRLGYRCINEQYLSGSRVTNVNYGHSFVNISSGIMNGLPNQRYRVSFLMPRDINAPNYYNPHRTNTPSVKFNIIERTRDGIVTREIEKDAVRNPAVPIPQPPTPDPDTPTDPDSPTPTPTPTPDPTIDPPVIALAGDRIAEDRIYPWYNSNYLYRDHYTAGANDGNDYVNVLANITHNYTGRDGEIVALRNDDGSIRKNDFATDVVFTDENGKLLKFNPVTGDLSTSRVTDVNSTWNVLLPHVNKSAGFFIYYGGAFDVNQTKLFDKERSGNERITGTDVTPDGKVVTIRTFEGQTQNNQRVTFRKLPTNPEFNSTNWGTRIVSSGAKGIMLSGSNVRLRYRLTNRQTKGEIPDDFKPAYCEITSPFLDEKVRIAPCVNDTYFENVNWGFSERGETKITYRMYNQEQEFYEKKQDLTNHFFAEFENEPSSATRPLRRETNVTYVIKYREHNGRVTNVSHWIDGVSQEVLYQGNKAIINARYPDKVANSVPETFNFTFDFNAGGTFTYSYPFFVNLIRSRFFIDTINTDRVMSRCDHQNEVAHVQLLTIEKAGNLKKIGDRSANPPVKREFRGFIQIFDPKTREELSELIAIAGSSSTRQVICDTGTTNTTLGIKVGVAGWNDFVLPDVPIIIGENQSVNLYTYETDSTDSQHTPTEEIEFQLTDNFGNVLPDYVMEIHSQVQDGTYYKISAARQGFNGISSAKINLNVSHNLVIKNPQGKLVTSLHGQRILCLPDQDCIQPITIDVRERAKYSHRLFDTHYTAPRLFSNLGRGGTTRRISYVTSDFYSVDNPAKSTKNVMIVQQVNSFGRRVEVSRCQAEGVSGRLVCNFFRLPHQTNPLYVYVYEINPVDDSLIRIAFLNFRIPLTDELSEQSPMVRDTFTLLFTLLAFGFVLSSLFNKQLAMLSLVASFILGIAFGIIQGTIIGGATTIVWMVTGIIVMMWKLRRNDTE